MAGTRKKSAAWLPDDILIDILSYLPATSVARFRSVSRSWRAVLSSAPFVQLHLRRASRPGQLKVFFHSNTGVEDVHLGEHYFYSWQQHGGPAKKLMRDDFSDGFASLVTKPLHGLVLIRTLGHAGGYYVFNPCTRAVLALPDTKISWKINCNFIAYLTGRTRPPAYKNVSYGLGYCSATGEYKVVRLFSDPDGGSLAATCCEVFVLDAPACWRPTSQQLPPECAANVHSPAVFLDGLLYFLCRDSFDVITFDVGDETFGSAPPLPLGKEAAIDVNLTELDGCLCAYYAESYRFVCHVAHVWRLRDHDHEAARWEQLCRVDMAAWPEADRLPLESISVDPLTIHDGGGGEKKIIFRTGACRVFAVDLSCAGATPEILLKPEDVIAMRVIYLSRKNRITCSFEDNHEPRLGLFEESLVPVGRTVEEAVFSSPANRAWSDVLKWLPARSALELSLVCRAWCAMVTTKRFIRSHAVHANMIAKHPRIKLVMDFAAGEFADLDDLIISGNRPKLCTSTPFFCSPPCHGLNLRSYGSSHFVFNPCMGYQLRIDVDDDDDDEYYDEEDGMCGAFAGIVALGYDAATGRHVVVHLLFRWRNFETRSYDLRCMAMLVGDGRGRWGLDRSLPRPVDLDVPAAYANGKMYWVVDSRLMASPSSAAAAACELLALDMEARKFKVIQGPPCRHGDGRMTLLELHGALCVACSDRSANAIDMWTVKDDGAWSVEYHVELAEFSPEYSSETTTPMAVDPVDGRILLNTGTSLGYYDPKTSALETIYGVGIQEDVDGLKYRFCPVICQESLVCPLLGDVD